MTVNTLDEFSVASQLNGEPFPEPIVLLTVAGTAAFWDQGYPADLARALVYARPDLFVWQGVNYPATTFPMKKSYSVGVTEATRLLTLPRAFGGWLGYRVILIGYSQGAIVTSILLQAWQAGTLDINLIGGVTWGNPMREKNHTLPAGIDNGGQGIVSPNNVGTPRFWYDFADDAAMVNSPGDDLYTKAGKGGNALSLSDEQAVWDVVNTANPTSLALAVASLLLHPSFSGSIGAAQAAFHALGFFVGEQILPHTSYQVVQPITGDTRDCWAMAYDHCMDIALAA